MRCGHEKKMGTLLFGPQHRNDRIWVISYQYTSYTMGTINGRHRLEATASCRAASAGGRHALLQGTSSRSLRIWPVRIGSGPHWRYWARVSVGVGVHPSRKEASACGARAGAGARIRGMPGDRPAGRIADLPVASRYRPPWNGRGQSGPRRRGAPADVVRRQSPGHPARTRSAVCARFVVVPPPYRRRAIPQRGAPRSGAPGLEGIGQDGVGGDGGVQQ